MSGKRPLPEGAGTNQDGDSKRMRGMDGSPAPAPGQPTEEEKAAKTAAAKAKIAALKERLRTGKDPAKATPPAPTTRAAPVTAPVAVQATAAVPGPPPVGDKAAAAKAKIAAFKAKQAAELKIAQGANGGGAQKTQAQAAPAANPAVSELQARIKEKRRQVEESKARAAAQEDRRAPPAHEEEPRQPGRTSFKNAPLHPLLMSDSGPAFSGKGPKFSTTKGNKKVNPYLAETDGDEAGAGPKRERERKTGFNFVTPGKHIRQANALRDQLALEEMKVRMALETRKTDIEEASDRSLLVPAPPEIEWWDEGLLAAESTTYDAWDQPDGNRIEPREDLGQGSIITNLVQHPRLDEPPQDKFAPPPKPLMLTAKEQAKVRRQRRMADMKEEQAKVRLGLVEPPPPKVKKSNMMRVLGEEAVKDPTAVEARVNREIAAREEKHLAQNEDRKLSKEQRAEKLKQQQLNDAKLGIRTAVFRILSLVSGKHRYAVDVHAKQNNLTGIVVLHPSMCLIVVEGGRHSINLYRKALRRVRWTENPPPQSSNESNSATTFVGNKDNQAKAEDRGLKRDWMSPWSEQVDAAGNLLLKDLAKLGNGCTEVWEGELKERKFRNWGSRLCETDGEAMEVLRRAGMENMWTLAKSAEGGLPEAVEEEEVHAAVGDMNLDGEDSD